MRIKHLAVMLAVLVLIIGAVGLSSARDPRYEPDMDGGCESSLDGYQSDVKACLERATELSQAKKCWLP